MPPIDNNQLVPSAAAYLPMDRRRELAGLEAVPTHDQGSALYADISGFTRLTEELGSTLGGRRGAEEITTLLNGVFGPITSVIDRYGGSVISFGGDSVIAWFPGDDGYAAVTVAVELLEIVRSFPTDYVIRPSDRLGIKAAVASGSAIRLRAGEPEHGYMDVLAGEVIDSLNSEAQGLAAGEVAVSREVAASLRDRAVIETLDRDGREQRRVVSMNRRAPFTGKFNLFDVELTMHRHVPSSPLRNHSQRRRRGGAA